MLTLEVQVFRVDRYRVKTFDHTILRTKRDFFLRQLVFKTKCRSAVDDGNLPVHVHVNADNPLRSEPFAKLLESSRNRSATCLFSLLIRLSTLWLN